MGIRGCVTLNGEKSADQLEKESSGLSPGWFRASVMDVDEKEGNLRLTFQLEDGRRYVETLWDPSASAKPAPLQQRRDTVSIRLGLVPREAKGIAFEFDWLDAIGRECILHLVQSKPNSKGQSFVRLEWTGLFAADDPRGVAQLPKDERYRKSAEKAVDKPLSKAAPEAAFDFDDL